MSPIWPAPSGNGLAMRAWQSLKALQASHDVSLLVVALYPSPAARELPEGLRFLRKWPVPAVAHRMMPWISSSRLPEAAARLAPLQGACARAMRGEYFDVVHAFRCYMGPLAQQIAAQQNPRARLQIDLDDVDATTLAAMAEMHQRQGEWQAALTAALEAHRFRLLEEELLPQCERIFVASESGRQVLALRHVGSDVARRIIVAPNTYPLAPVPWVKRFAAKEEAPFTMLFIGTLGYAPNAVGLRKFCRRVWPQWAEAMRARAREPRLIVAGAGASTSLRRELEASGADFRGFVSELGPLYEEAQLVVAPIPCGGGTRLKILEAFRYGVPVVSTTAGADGLKVVSGKHLILADRDDDFLRACLAIVDDPLLAAELAAAGVRLLRREHSDEVLRRCFAPSHGRGQAEDGAEAGGGRSPAVLAAHARDER